MKKINGNDVLFVVGLGLLGYGLFLVYMPLAFIVPGMVLIVLAVLGARSKAVKS